jgi:two-component system CheB/CheR fusion protein
MSFADFTHPDDIDIDEQLYNDLLSGKIDSYKLEKRYLNKDQKIVWALLHVTSVKNKNGKIKYAVKILKNITDKKIIEDKLKLEKQFSQKVAATSTHGIYIYDIKKGKNIFTNKQYQEILGYTNEELLSLSGEDFGALFHPDDQEAIENHIKEVSNGAKNLKIEYRFKHKNGDWIWLYSVDTPFDVDDNGNVTSFMGSFINITDLKNYERELDQKNHILSQSQERAKIGSWYLDLKTDKVTWTEQLYLMYGLDPNLPPPDYSLQHKIFTPKSWEALSKAVNKTIAEGGSYELELEMASRANGKKGWMWAFGEAIKNKEGQIVALSGAAQDITDWVIQNQQLLKAKKEAESANLLKNNFLANMSHEIRTPMNGIIGFADLLKNENLGIKDRKKYLDVIKSNSDQLLNIIDDIINISKIESNHLPIVIADCNLSKIFHDLTLNFNRLKLTKGKEHIVLKPVIPTEYKNLIVKTDGARISQVFINLIGNALKFSKKGEISYGFNVTATELKFFVKDEGIGIPKDKLEEIFERFKQVNYHRDAKYGGTGLGLAISKGIINLLGGNISVTSKVNIGTEFTFTIPLELGEEKKKKNEKLSSKDIDFKDKTILIAEDDELVQLYFTELFRDTEATILLAANGEEAVDIFKKHAEIDLVLMDLRMPILNGFEAMDQILDLNRNAKIIAQTAYAMIDEKQKCLDKGCIDYITKPIKKDQLMTLVGKYI